MFQHLTDVCMTYCEHMSFSLYLAWEFMFGTIAAVIHAIFPCCFVTHSSSMVTRIQEKMKEIGCRDNDIIETPVSTSPETPVSTKEHSN